MNPGGVFYPPDVVIHLARGRFAFNSIIYSDLREFVEASILPASELESPNSNSIGRMGSLQHYENKGYI
jgi:hypothetical protein